MITPQVAPLPGMSPLGTNPAKAYDIVVTKDKYHGWIARTQEFTHAVPATPNSAMDGPGERFVKLTTSKDSRGNITSHASVFIERDSGNGYRTQSHMLYGDYSKRIHTVTGKNATEKNIRTIHAEALCLFASVIEEVKAFYEKKGA
jgi:hypothetical protein